MLKSPLIISTTLLTALLWTTALTLTFLTLGCGKSAQPGESSANENSATVAVAPHAVKVSLGPELALVRNQADITPTFELTDTDVVSSPLVFGVVSNEQRNTVDPIILRKAGATWKITALDDMHQKEWVYVGACPTRHELWGILEAADENRDATLSFVRSADGGETWETFSALKKAAASADFVSFYLDAKGIGRVSLHADPPEGQDQPRGYYHYKTTDGAKTWTGPTFEADELTPSEKELPETLAATLQAIDKPSPVTTGPAR